MNSVAISFVAYSLGIVLLGLVSTRFSKPSHSDFLLADRGLGPWVAGLSAAASAESGWVTMGLVGFAYKTGVGALWVVPGTFLAFLLNWFVLGPRLRQASIDRDSLTIVDVIASRYPRRWATLIRLLGVAIVLTMITAYVAAQLNAAGKTFSGTFEGWSYSAGVLLGASIVLVYTLVGGFRAVSWTDVVQSVFMILAVTAMPLLLINKIGGVTEFWTQLGALDDGDSMTSLLAGKSGYGLMGFLALWLGIPLGNHGQPHSLIRLMSTKDDRAIRLGGVICSGWVLVLFTGAIFLGMTARVYFDGLSMASGFDPEKVLPVIATDANLIPGAFGGMLLAAILAAICSTADSQLLVSASAVSHDLIEKVCGYELTLKRRKIVERSALILAGVVATAIALGEVRSVFSFVLDYGWAGLGAGFGPALIMTLLWNRTSGPAVLAGMVVGVSVAVVWKQIEFLSANFYAMIPAFFASLLTIVFVSYMNPHVDKTRRS